MRKDYIVPLPGGRKLELGRRTALVGVVNVTPDSFSDGGENLDPERAAARALEMEASGADVVEIGGESTRPRAAEVPPEEEMARVIPVLDRLAGRLRVPISIDTYKAVVARAAVERGASIINDVSALRFDPELADVAARSGAALILMHMRGTPADMQQIEPSEDIFSDIESDLVAAVSRAESRGVARTSMILDPGIGFGKTLEQNLEIISRLDRLKSLGFPLMIGTSRKSFIGRLTGRPESERIWGTAASISIAISRGAHIVRVHDVREMVEVARVTDAILAGAAVG